MFVYCCLCWSTVICVGLLLFVLVYCYLCWSIVICVGLLLFVLVYRYLCWSIVICVDLLLFVLIYCYVLVYCYLCWSIVICVVLCIVRVYMCTVLLPPGVNPIAVNKYIISYVPLLQCLYFHNARYFAVLRLVLGRPFIATDFFVKEFKELRTSDKIFGV